MPGLLEDKVAIVTGGSSGIGRGIVEKYVAEGAKVVIADIRDDDGSALAGQLGENAAFVHSDVTKEESIESTVAFAVDTFGRLDVMVNNAGAQGDPSTILDVHADGFDKTIALLTRSVLLGTKYAAAQFIQQGSPGSVISTASAAALQGGWSAVGYTAAKHAVVGLVRQAAAELGQYGIRANAIAPGIIMTPIMSRTFGVEDGRSEEFTTFLAERLGPGQPSRRVGFPADIAGVATFLASELSEYVNGTVIPVDGGATSVTLGTFATDVVAAANEFVSGAAR
ncbi:glucose 1-dehydrogenase [Rhodococcus sp. BP-252]|uniref:SDR family NAD(P)-dependent oxidoreductase n=1 Tax=unclassified Rhodococcus (in: high G+C Gram-positive bacteria) TaxID=192944 RepID=UPI001C9ABF3A|nr:MULTISPECIES: glucose 1-dehydrogenase [unclassified Rhodococcus (in: high G+C Gram-positive bacteria)]MBY6413429.1 glucose 1-dehydrogenase [Rhodococcus sp. BP-320]MBY6418123.1 glucose 1-dehydrogenase [Rhodococcus sp. BP-321]MBY6422396.1 glucose 1-dehydrogenase [Rhodococcus sp. BP-324]MBY6428623.1 glucose 1-dehydrogenase [Rhodococcus sp. BP-323]MBY6433629.1 glucose 1-dehydrogenase [Rhodococcus sp. BP-322]